jgi:hypothetical protein
MEKNFYLVLNDFIVRSSYICITIKGGFIMAELANLNWGLLAPIIIIQIILLVVSLVDLFRIERTNGPKWMWILIILLINIIGPILYFVIGRRNQ